MQKRLEKHVGKLVENGDDYYIVEEVYNSGKDERFQGSGILVSLRYLNPLNQKGYLKVISLERFENLMKK